MLTKLSNNFAWVAEKEHSNSPKFQLFRRQLFHTSLSHILSSLRPAMSKPEVVKCADGLYRRVIYSLGPYIADYPEQVLVSGIVQGWCPRYLFAAASLKSPTQALYDVAGVLHTRMTLKLREYQGQRSIQTTFKKYLN